ncbi:MAG: ketopantoate reductase family protein, partial [Chitinophagales bacterium]
MRILSVGLGALGTVFSCFLQNKGHEVWALDREDWVNSLPDKTVKVTGIWGDKSAMLSGLVSDPDQLEGPFDLV